VTEDVYRAKLDRFKDLLKMPWDGKHAVQQLGHGIKVLNSVPAVIFAFLSHPKVTFVQNVQPTDR
jgi:ADP-ribosylglycohydrolase